MAINSGMFDCGRIKVGDWVETNGDGAGRTVSKVLCGIVGKVGKDFFYVFHDNPEFTGQYPREFTNNFGKRYSWCIGKRNPDAFVRVINVATYRLSFTFNKTKLSKPMNLLARLSNTLKTLLSPAIKSQVEAGFRDEGLNLTSEGCEALMNILAVKNEAELAAEADKLIAERKAEEKK